mmetsp:Transcript_11934/g.25834  ORF Transcript_11934/g.25834 Transcript_11934/m.25834 type:complete len:354 (-) Transcript_11934:191-1252(-)
MSRRLRNTSVSSTLRPMAAALLVLSSFHGDGSSSYVPSFVAPVAANKHTDACPIPCHHGRCVEVEVGVTYKCDCHKPDSDTMIGYTGPSCDIPFNQCLDYERRCMNNSECKISTKTPGKYTCDCSKAFSISSYAGHECQYSATEVCEAGTPVSDDAFCVNGGTCRKTVLKGEVHPGCDCPEEFEGSKCQFLKGTAPEDEGTAFVRANTRGGSSSGDEKMNPGVVAIIVLVSLGFVMGIAGLIYVKKRDERDHKATHDDAKIEIEDMQTTGESSNSSSHPPSAVAAEHGFTNDDKRGTHDLVLEADGSASFGHDSPIKKEMEEEANKANGTSVVPLAGEEEEGDDEDGAMTEVL